MAFGHQGLDAELLSLTDLYAPPNGRMLIAEDAREILGGVAYKRIDEDTCEMKRLYVRPAFRRFGLGRLLAQALFDEARSVGYSTMLLDTLDDMGAARGLYASLGFEEIAPYYYSPIAGSHYLKADLD
jgi:GNAT superfamily N-acetyltransferase